MKTSRSQLGTAALVVLFSVFASTIAPFRPSQTQAVFGGADESAPSSDQTAENSPNQRAALLAATPFSEEIDYAAADALLTSGAALTGQATSAGSGTSRTEVVTYTVQDGDTLSSIAARFNISLTTLLNSNSAIKPSALQIGQEITILPVDGLVHTVKSGDTLAGLAIRYGVKPETISQANDINDSVITIGQRIIVPGGSSSALSNSATQLSASSLTSYIARVSSGAIYPLTNKGRQVGGRHGRYGAYDLAAPTGTSIVATEAGIVEYVGHGWQGGYGNRVVIRHDSGRQTLYAHMSSITVTTGQYVERGQHLGGVGSTGQSTGPHLHFEVR